MGDEGRMMNFVSEKQLDELKATRGSRPEDGTVSVDKPLWEILKTNKEAKDAEFAEKHRHKTQKTLDEDEVYFLDAVDLHQREQEKVQREAEAQEMAAFQAALLEKQLGTSEPVAPKPKQKRDVEPPKPGKRRVDSQLNSLASLIKLKPQPKKQRVEAKQPGPVSEMTEGSRKAEPEKERTANSQGSSEPRTEQSGGLLNLQSYGTDDDEGEDENG